MRSDRPTFPFRSCRMLVTGDRQKIIDAPRKSEGRRGTIHHIKALSSPSSATGGFVAAYQIEHDVVGPLGVILIPNW